VNARGWLADSSDAYLLTAAPKRRCVANRLAEPLTEVKPEDVMKESRGRHSDSHARKRLGRK
jgi:hypothetical protein